MVIEIKKSPLVSAMAYYLNETMLIKEFLCSGNDVSPDRNSSRPPHITFICCSGGLYASWPYALDDKNQK